MKVINEDFIREMRELLGDQLDKFLFSLNEPSKKGIIVNKNKTTIEQFESIVDFECKPIDFDPYGYYIADVKLGRHPLHHAGAFYMQDPGAMFTINAYKFKGDERVLDMCASPGGKSIQIANRIPNGILVSNEINKSRSQILYSNIERMGLKNVIITNETPERIGKAYGDAFDVCLVDAPCSAEGMIRKDESILKNWNKNLTKMCATRQLEILDAADKTLKQGGVLIYSTCTYSRVENEDVVNAFKDKYGYELINIDCRFSRGIGMPEAVRMYPHATNGEGQFVAVLKKLSSNDNVGTKELKLKRNEKVEKFLTNNTSNFGNVYDFVDYSYVVKDLDLIRQGVNYVSIGVRVASEKAETIKPEHYLFSAFGQSFNHKIDLKLDSLELSKYLKGDVFSAEGEDCYGVIMVENIPLGGYKIAGGMMKNLYPKGLRNFN